MAIYESQHFVWPPTRPGESKPPDDLDPATSPFYAWTALTDEGETVAWDYAPDDRWLTGPMNPSPFDP